MGLFSLGGRIKSLIFCWFGVTLITVWSCLLYYTAITVTVSTVDEDLLYPLKHYVHPHIIGYFLSTFTFSMVISSLIIFYTFERRNRIRHWLQHPYVKEAREKNPLGEEQLLETKGLEKYKWMVSKEEINRKSVMLMCPICMTETCSRAHHCPKCKKCVLRRDHHCFVLGACVGLGNQRFFVNTLFWCFFGCALFIAFHGHHFLTKSYSMVREYGSLFPQEVDFILGSDFWFGIRPVYILAFCLSNEPSDRHICDFIILSFTLAWLLVTLIFFCAQVVFTAKGYTMYELSRRHVLKRLHPDGFILKDRFRLVFGERWLLNIFFPNMWDEAVLTKEIAVNLFRPKNKAD